GEPCLWAAMAAEAASAPTPYRYGVWGATTPAARARIANELGLDASGYEALLHTALQALHSPQDGPGAHPVPPEAATVTQAAPEGHQDASARPPRPTTPRQRRRELRHDRARRRRIAERIAADPTLTDLTKTVAVLL
ncbi:MAG: hypothetical protein M3011_07260, partial [Actinomycetota bacterium]|nr:hypothetical protein [Actinomycetota bacterium]